MSCVQFILGRAGAGKTYWCVQRAAAALRQASNQPLVLLVPEQATYQMERAVLSEPHIEGFSRLKILSFQRLGFWLKRHQPLKHALEPLGKTLVVQRCLLQMAEQLHLLKPSEHRLGLAARLTDLIEQLADADVSAEQLHQAAATLLAKTPSDPAARKWQDLALIFKAYQQFFEDPAAPLNPCRYLADAKAAIRQADFLKEAILWVDGFAGFTAQEKAALLEMLRCCQQAYIALCLDPQRIDLNNTDIDQLDPSSPFYPTERTYCDLLACFQKCQFTVLPPVQLTEPRRFAVPALRWLEQNLFSAEISPFRADGAVQLVVCVNPQQEVEYAAQEILQKVKREHYRWRQIAVVASQPTVYTPYIESVFRRLDIPYFIDTPTGARQHPLLEAISSALTAAQTFQTSEIICLAKTGLLRILPWHIEQLEQYVLKYGVEGRDWTEPQQWSFSAHRQENQRAQRLRQKILAVLRRLHLPLFANPQPMTAVEFIQTVWDFLDYIKATKTLDRWLAQAPTDPLGHRQVFEQVVSLLDLMAQVFGSFRQSAAMWAEILRSAASEIVIKRIPPALDQILVGTLERSRHPDIRMLIILGGCQKWFPAPLALSEMFSKTDRLAIAGCGINMPEPIADQLNQRTYLAYIAFTRPSERLLLTVPKNDLEDAPLMPSPWVERLMALFDDVKLTAASPPASLWDCLHPSQLACQLAQAVNPDQPDADKAAQAAFVLQATEGTDWPALAAALQPVRYAMVYDNQPTLAADAAEPMRRWKRFSATSLATFAHCPFQFFAKYVLNLRPTGPLRLEPVDIGDFYHQVLQTLFSQLRQRQLSWSTADSALLDELFENCCQHILQRQVNLKNVLRHSLHIGYLLDSAKVHLRRFINALGELERAGPLRQALAEYPFEIKLGEIVLTGRIDRLDVAVSAADNNADRRIGFIFDFKRAPKKCNWTALTYGLDLQLLVYLLAADGLPAELKLCQIGGAFYLPLEQRAQPLSLADWSTASNAKFAYKTKGIFCADFIHLLVNEPPRGANPYYDFYVKQDGNPTGNYHYTSILTRADFQALLAYGRQLICQLAEQVHRGHIDVAPYKTISEKACDHCDYKPLCRFDWQINRYRHLQNVDKTQAIALFRQDRSLEAD